MFRQSPSAPGKANEAPPSGAGLTYVPDGPGGFRVELGAPDAPALRRLLAWLPEGLELSFYDRFYPSMSDPGAFVRVQRRGDVLVHMFSNHGWLSDWAKQSAELLAAWIMINLDAAGPQSSPVRELVIAKPLCTP